MKKVKLSFTFLVLFSVLSCRLFAQSTLIEKVEPTSNPLIIPYEKWKLQNGLTLIINEDHSNPVVTVMVVCHVGSARESIGKSGFAHLFEHMMFEGSGHVGGKEAERIVSEVGGNGNAFTKRDMTTYFETVPSNNLEVALWMESDRMGFLLDSVTKDRFENQRSTVKNEKGQNFENRPYGLTEEILDQTLYPSSHPYSWPVIGYSDDLDRVTVQDLKNFFMRWYGPNNSVLTVAGDVNPKEVLAMVEKYFGSIPRCPEVKKMRVPEPVLASDKYANFTDNVYAPLTFMVYPTVPAYHHDEAALDLLGAMMGEGKSSVFYKNFDKTEKYEAAVGHNSSELGGEFSIQVLAYPNYDDVNMENAPQDKAGMERFMHDLAQKNFDETEKKIHQTIDEFEKTGITDSSLQMAKAKKESDIADGVVSISEGGVNEPNTVFEKALLLSNWQTFLDKPYNLQDEMDRYDKVTKEDIARVFNKYIKGKYAGIVDVHPRDQNSQDSTKSHNPNANVKFTDDPQYNGLVYVKAVDNFDRSKRPPAGPAKPPVVPQFYTNKLKNGVNIIGTQAAQAPKVFILITIKGGELVAGDVKKTGIAALTAAVMNEGTKNFTTEQISSQLDLLGSFISFNGSEESTTIVVSSLTKNIDATLKILEEKLLRPGFNASDFKRVREQFIQSLSEAKKSPPEIASRAFQNIVYGNTMLGSYTTEKIIKKLSVDDVKNYYAQYYSPSAANVVIVGDIPENEALKKMDFLNQWKGKEIKMPEITNLPDIQQTQIYIADVPGAAQTVVAIGNLSMPFDATGEYFKANVMNFSLGGGFNSRLNLNLREDKGYTYGINSSFQGSKYPGVFVVGASVKRSATDTCITEIMKELTNYKTSGPTDDEITYTKNSILNSDALKYESPEQKARFLSRIIEYNLPKDYPSQQADIVKNLSKNDFNSLANKYINPDKMVILVVGNSYLIKNKLNKLGYKVKDVALD